MPKNTSTDSVIPLGSEENADSHKKIYFIALSKVSERRLRPIYDWLDNGNNKKALQEADKVNTNGIFKCDLVKILFFDRF